MPRSERLQIRSQPALEAATKQLLSIDGGSAQRLVGNNDSVTNAHPRVDKSGILVP